MLEEQALALLNKKWIVPLVNKINELPKSIVDSLTKKVINLSKKYETTLVDIDNDIKDAENDLISMLDELDANEDDTLGLKELKKLLGGE